MPRRRTSSPDRITQDFLDAIERLKDGRPQHPELREKIKSGKSVKINIRNVAKEAGRARGLIGKEDCRYPKIRQLILAEADASGTVPKTRDDVIKKLRMEIAELRVQLSNAEAHAAFHFAQRTTAEKGQRDYKGRYERLKARVNKELKAREGKVVSLFPETGDESD